MTPRQRRFVAEYLTDLNATQAAIRAGYSADTANREGSRLLSNVVIHAAIRSAEGERLGRAAVAADDIVRELVRIARADVRRIFDGTSLLPPCEWDDDTAAAVQSLKVTTRRLGEGEVEHVAEVRLWPKGPALEALAKRAWPERRGRPVRFEMPEITKPADVVVALGRIAAAVSAGTLTPEEGQAVASIVETHRRAIETEDLARRIAELEVERGTEGRR
nr:terminase small subunit [Roseomonas acroporae]